MKSTFQPIMLNGCFLQPVASTINTLAGALYKVFSASPDEARKEMRQACFDYLSLGGIFSAGPVSLLSGLNPRPLSLVLHFFAVAVYGVGRLLLPFPSPKGMWIGARLISVRIIYCLAVDDHGVLFIFKKICKGFASLEMNTCRLDNIVLFVLPEIHAEGCRMLLKSHTVFGT